MLYSNTRITSKRRGDGRVDFVANAGYSQRDLKNFRRDGGNYRDSGNYRANNTARPKFDPAALLNQPCVYHGREGKPATHTTADCHSLKEIAKARRAQDDPNNKPPRDNGNTGDFGNTVESLHTFTGIGTKREKKVLNRVVVVNAMSQVDVPASSTGSSSASRGSMRTTRHGSSTPGESPW